MLPVHYFGVPIQGTGQVVAYGASTPSAALTKTTGAVRLVASTDCFIEIGSGAGTTPTAVNSTSTFLPAGRPEYFEVTRGCKVAAVQSAAPGNLYLTEF